MHILDRHRAKRRYLAAGNGQNKDPQLEKISNIVFKSEELLRSEDIQYLINQKSDAACMVLVSAFQRDKILGLTRDQVNAIIEMNDVSACVVILEAVRRRTPITRDQAEILCEQAKTISHYPDEILSEAAHNLGILVAREVPENMLDQWRSSIAAMMPLYITQAPCSVTG